MLEEFLHGSAVLRIQQHDSSSGYSYGMGLIPGLGTSACVAKNEKKIPFSLIKLMVTLAYKIILNVAYFFLVCLFLTISSDPMYPWLWQTIIVLGLLKEECMRPKLVQQEIN